jgi:hypothetical protein
MKFLLSFFFYLSRVDPDSNLFKDLEKFKAKEAKDHILLSFLFKVNSLLKIILTFDVFKPWVSRLLSHIRR